MKKQINKLTKSLILPALFILPLKEVGNATNKDSPVVKKDKKIVVLDAGHGYGNKNTWKMDWGGAFYKDKTGKEFRESDLTLQYAKNIAKRFDEKNYEVLFTREDDIYPTPLHFRPYFAREVKADFFISIHINNINDYRRKELSGFEIFYSNKKSENLANIFARNFEKINIPRSRRGISKVEDFAVLKGIDMPSLILELGYFTHKNDREWILKRNNEIEKTIAKSIEQIVSED